jgi:hypothetical protein
VIVNFVDIEGIGDYHSLTFLYLIRNGECTMREAINTLCHILEIWQSYSWWKKSLKIPKGQSESVYRRTTDNTMAKRKKYKRTNNDLQNMHIKLKIE